MRAIASAWYPAPWLAAGIECRECAGKDYYVAIGGNLTNTTRPINA